MLVQVEALAPFVTILDGGDMISAVRGDRPWVPKKRADELVAGKAAKYVEPLAPPENKTAGSAPEVKTTTKRRQPAKPKPATPAE